MEAFAELLDTLSTAQSRTRKLEFLARYLRSTADPDRGHALAALTDGLALRLPLRRALLEVVSQRVDPHLYKLSRDYVGDTAETVALIWRSRETASAARLSLDDVISAFSQASAETLPALLASLLDRMDARGRWAMLKLIGGAPRVGISARMAKTALAQAFNADVDEIEEVWPALSPPYRELFAWLCGQGPRPSVEGRPLFRPMMLSTPLESGDEVEITPNAFAAEWKWDGIRVQLVASGGEVRMFSRTGDDISAAFPEIGAAVVGLEVTLDGELLVMRDGVVAPFNDLQKRLNRKTVTLRMMREFPAHVRVYDLMLADGTDLRGESFTARRAVLEAWVAGYPQAKIDISPLIAFRSYADLAERRRLACGDGIEGLMLKRRSSPYLAGRVRGHWYKWKRDPLTADCVLLYAQRGSGKRSSFYSDFTFGAWRTDGQGGRELVPVGKAYSGFTDEELRRLDRFVRENTVESYGPVRALRAELVVEVAFDGVQRSSRHKSGIAMRFPRFHRIRWDKPAAEADWVATIGARIDGGSGG